MTTVIVGQNRFDVFMARDIGPVLSQHGSAVGIGLTLPQNAHTCPLESEVESADSAEEAANG